MLVLFIDSNEKVAPGLVSGTAGWDDSMYRTHMWRHTRYTMAPTCALGFRLKKMWPAEKTESSCRIMEPRCCCPVRILSRSLGEEYDCCHVPVSMSIDKLDEALLSSDLETA